MNKKHQHMDKQFYIVFFLFLFTTSEAFALPSAKVTLKVIDSEENPLVNAKAFVDFYEKQGLFSGKTTKKVNTARGGLATISGKSMGAIDYGAVKEGYYPTLHRLFLKKDRKASLFNRYQPWNPTLDVVLKKIKNPVSLSARNMEIDGLHRYLIIPARDKKIGFDLLEADWVAPYGKGIIPDFIFEYSGEAQSKRVFDYTLKLSFAEAKDGIQAVSAPVRYTSVLRLPYEAPTEGYNGQLNQRYARVETHYIHQDFPEDRNYFFRIRTKLDEQGNVVSALYGKIHGNIKFDTEGKIGFIYYLNPRPNERNLEFDPDQNLATGKQADYIFTP